MKSLTNGALLFILKPGKYPTNNDMNIFIVCSMAKSVDNYIVNKAIAERAFSPGPMHYYNSQSVMHASNATPLKGSAHRAGSTSPGRNGFTWSKDTRHVSVVSLFQKLMSAYIVLIDAGNQSSTSIWNCWRHSPEQRQHEAEKFQGPQRCHTEQHWKQRHLLQS
jgi:hypothetical protein